MNRTVWFVAGAGVGVYAMVKARRAAETFTPEGLRDRLSGLTVGAQLFADEVRAGMTEKETELRDRLGLTLDGPPELETVPRASGFETLAGARSSTTESTEGTD
jgi:diacylglycerol kinase family enzyme